MFPPEWICRPIAYDYGLDLSVEIVDGEAVTGREFFVQLKATEQLKTSHRDVIHRCKVSTARYFLQRLEPVMYIVYDAREEAAYWVWIQPYLRELEQTQPAWSYQKSIQVRVPLANKLTHTSIPEIRAYMQNWWDTLVPFTRQYLRRCDGLEQAHVFICHDRSLGPDQRLAAYLQEFLIAQGHEVSMGAILRAAPDWLEEIDRRIKASDLLVLLLSEASADSEMVQAEIRRAYEYRKHQGHPHTLPVRLAYEGLLPYSIDFFLDPFRYVAWQGDDDNERAGVEILTALEGWLERRQPIRTQAETRVTISDDGRVVGDSDALHSPLPVFDPRALVDPEMPRGVVRLPSRFYIERRGDSILREEVLKPGSLTYIRAARQTGKSSLLIRGIAHAREHEIPVIFVDFQFVDSEHLADLDTFLRCMAELISESLGVTGVEDVWRSSLSPTLKMSTFLGTKVLRTAESPWLLAIDEADRVYGTTFQDDFFGMIRAWYNRAQWQEVWKRLITAMVISTEPHLLIRDRFQSPFNIGRKIELEDFEESQVADLNQRHGDLISSAQIHEMTEYLGGHPYLTRRAFYALASDHLNWGEIVERSMDERGPFGDHLSRYLWLLRDKPELASAMKQIMNQQPGPDGATIQRLQAAGLIRRQGSQLKCRCTLYERFFEKHLR